VPTGIRQNMSNVLLSDLVMSLKQQLTDLVLREKEDGEVEVEATTSASSKGGVAFWVLSGEKSGSTANKSSQKVRLTMTPNMPLVLGGGSNK
jgi:hypothetical protein